MKESVFPLNLETWGNDGCLTAMEFLNCMVPTWTGKPGKLRELYPKYWKSEGILDSFCFYFFSDFLIEVCLLNRFLNLVNTLNDLLKNTGKWKKRYWKSQENLSVRKCGKHELCEKWKMTCRQENAECTQTDRHNIPYLFELRHPVPRPNFYGVPLFKKSKDRYTAGNNNNFST